MGIAVNTDAFWIGNLGTPDRLQFGIAGKAVNDTFQLVRHASPSPRESGIDILITHGTYVSTKDSVDTTHQSPYYFETAGRIIKAYTLNGPKPNIDLPALINQAPAS